MTSLWDWHALARSSSRGVVHDGSQCSIAARCDPMPACLAAGHALKDAGRITVRPRLVLGECRAVNNASGLMADKLTPCPGPIIRLATAARRSPRRAG